MGELGERRRTKRVTTQPGSTVGCAGSVPAAVPLVPPARSLWAPPDLPQPSVPQEGLGTAVGWERGWDSYP